jgi:hypothetical protein
MRRVLLVVSMLVSLWPAAVIANAAISGSSNPSNRPANATAVASGGGVNQAQQPDYAGLKGLQDRESQLLQRFHNSHSLKWIPDRGLAQTASQLAADYGTWKSTNAGLDNRADNVETLEATIANRVAAFSRHPSQARLDAFNQAVSAYTANLHASSP